MIDGESGFIVAREVSNEPTDVNRLLPVIEGTKQNLGLERTLVPDVTDGGYY